MPFAPDLDIGWDGVAAVASVAARASIDEIRLGVVGLPKAVAACASVERVASAVPAEPVVAGAADDDVVSAQAKADVVSTAEPDDVVPNHALDPILPGVAVQDIRVGRSVGALHGVEPIATLSPRRPLAEVDRHTPLRAAEGHTVPVAGPAADDVVARARRERSPVDPGGAEHVVARSASQSGPDVAAAGDDQDDVVAPLAKCSCRPVNPHENDAVVARAAICNAAAMTHENTVVASAAMEDGVLHPAARK